MARTDQRKGLRTVVLVAILAGAAVIRLWGADWGLPYAYHPDEGSILFHSLGFGTGDLNPHWFRWPSLMMYVMFGAYGGLFVIGKVAGFYAVKLDLVRHYVTDISVFWYMGRVVSALSGVATVWVTYLFGKRSFGRFVGLTAAAVLAVMYLHVRDSHYATPDVFSTLLASMSLLAALTAVSTGRASRLVLSALLAGLAASAKYPAAVAAVGTLVGLVVLVRRRRVRFIHFVLIVMAPLAGFLVGTPYALLSRAEFVRDVARQFTMVSESGIAQEASSFVEGLSEILRGAVGRGIGWPVAVLALVGALLPLRLWREVLRRRGATNRVAVATIKTASTGRSIAVAYTAAVVLFAVLLTVKRATYLTPALPAVAFLAAVGVEGLFARLSSRRYRALAVAVLLVAAGAVPSVRFVTALGEPDSRTRARVWIEEHVPVGTRIAVEDYGPVLNPTVEQLNRELEVGATAVGTWEGPKRKLNEIKLAVGTSRSPKYEVYRIDWGSDAFRFPSTLEDAKFTAAVDSLRISYIVLSSKHAPWRAMVGAAPPRHPADEKLALWLLERGTPVAVFGDDTGMPVVDRGRGRSFHNPAIEIYRIAEPDTMVGG
ncbi:glycosyltransferase family 39 protein [bacterium]|nr:glycosyltransferase family 39 protein [bacterium]